MHKIFGRTVFQSEGKAHITNISFYTLKQNAMVDNMKIGQ